MLSDEHFNSTEGNFQLEVLDRLGQGRFGSVMKANYTKENVSKLVAVKIFFNNGNKNSFNREVNALKKTDHPNIIKLINTFKWEKKFGTQDCMIIELGDFALNDVIHNKKYDYSFGHAISWLYQLADGMNYLHTKESKPILHRDLKPHNLLMTKGGTVLKICDFGTVRDLGVSMTLEQGSPCWIAPEVMKIRDYNEKCDVYSYTIIAWELMIRQLPYFNLPYKSHHIMLEVANDNNPLRPVPISDCPIIFKKFLNRGMDHSPFKRPSMELIYRFTQTLENLVNIEPIKPLDDDDNTSLENDEITQTSDATISSTNKITQNKGIETKATSSDNLSNQNHQDSNHLLSRNKPSRHSIKFKKPLGHRRTKSYGTPATYNDKSYLYTQAELFLDNPIEPNETPESKNIYKQHCELLKEDKHVDDEIRNIKSQIAQLESTLNKITKYNKLSSQKVRLIEENQNLKDSIQISRQSSGGNHLFINRK